MHMNVSKNFSPVFFYIAIYTSPDEEFLLNQNLSIRIISNSKIVLMKYFCIEKSERVSK